MKYTVVFIGLLLSKLAIAQSVNPYGFIRCETHKMSLVTIDSLTTIKYDLKEQANVACDVEVNYLRCNFGRATLFKDYRYSLIIDTYSAKVISDLSGRPQRLMMKAALNGKEITCQQWIQ